jgi:hypothetical protein
MRVRHLLAAGLVLGAAAGCKDPATPPEELPPPVTVGMTCGTPSGTTIPCEIQLGSATAFRVTLLSSECRALANVVHLTKPIDALLTVDACRETVGKFWEFTVAANSSAALEIIGGQERNAPQLRVEGTGSPWTVRYEDGYDADFDDIILVVETL